MMALTNMKILIDDILDYFETLALSSSVVAYVVSVTTAPIIAFITLSIKTGILWAVLWFIIATVSVMIGLLASKIKTHDR